MLATAPRIGKGHPGSSQTEGEPADAGRRSAFRNLNGAVLMERLRSSGAAVRLGIGNTHYAVVQALAMHAPGGEWRLSVGPDGTERIVSGFVRLSQTKIAEKCHWKSPRTVQRMLRHLEETGIVVTESHRSTEPDGSVKTINRYRLSLPPECAADGAEGARRATEARDAAVAASGLKLRTDAEEATRTSPPMRHGRRHPCDTDVATHATGTSHIPSVPSDTSETSPAAAAPCETHGIAEPRRPDRKPAAAAAECDRIREVEFPPSRRVILSRPPEGGANGAGWLVRADGTQEALGIDPAAWALLEASNASEVDLAERKRSDGSRYWFASVKARASRAASPSARPTAEDDAEPDYEPDPEATTRRAWLSPTKHSIKLPERWGPRRYLALLKGSEYKLVFDHERAREVEASFAFKIRIYVELLPTKCGSAWVCMGIIDHLGEPNPEGDDSQAVVAGTSGGSALERGPVAGVRAER